MEIHFDRNTKFLVGFLGCQLFALLPYIWILPAYFSGYQTYFFFVVGILGIFALGARFVFMSLAPNRGMTSKIVTAVVGGTAVAAVSALILVSVIIWNRGS